MPDTDDLERLERKSRVLQRIMRSWVVWVAGLFGVVGGLNWCNTEQVRDDFETQIAKVEERLTECLEREATSVERCWAMVREVMEEKEEYARRNGVQPDD